ncbi:MAG: glutamate--tRNA ligase [Pseudomonadota bacterium]
MAVEGTVVTRFAPSPTGFLHIGGARTALFNWLYARGRNGRFLLRIEDTDRARHKEEAVEAILDGLAWLGLDWDGEPVSQYARGDRHRQAAEDLIAAGKAFRCYCADDELEALRAQAKAAGRAFRSPWRNGGDAPAQTPHVVRFRAADEGATLIDDAIQGEVRIDNRTLDDLVLLRGDGSPTYMLAVVVDDHDMGVTHIVRGDDHLTNAARQTQIFEALGWDVPRFAHMPLIHGPDGAKLSKRHGALGVEAYREMGFIAPALRNYLLRLGWAKGDEEIISDADAKAWFDLSGVGRAPARLDLDKLRHLNAHWLRAMAPADFDAALEPFIETHTERPINEETAARLSRGREGLRARGQTLQEMAAAADYLLAARPLQPTGKAAKPLRKDGVSSMLGRLDELLASIDPWALDALEAALDAMAEAEGGFGKIGPAARAALTAGAPSPGLPETIFALGRDEASARLRDQIASLSGPSAQADGAATANIT